MRKGKGGSCTRQRVIGFRVVQDKLEEVNVPQVYKETAKCKGGKYDMGREQGGGRRGGG